MAPLQISVEGRGYDPALSDLPRPEFTGRGTIIHVLLLPHVTWIPAVSPLRSTEGTHRRRIRLPVILPLASPIREMTPSIRPIWVAFAFPAVSILTILFRLVKALLYALRIFFISGGCQPAAVHLVCGNPALARITTISFALIAHLVTRLDPRHR